MLFKIVWSKVLHKKLNSLLSILLMVFGIGIISLVLRIGKEAESSLLKNIAGIDLVVGAKGSPLQIILSAVYHADDPTGNIKLAEVNKLKSNPLVKKIIPLAYGDNYQGTRILGSTNLLYDQYKLKISTGRIATSALEVTCGALAARKSGLKLGDSFLSSHGADKEGEKHEDDKYRVVGILERSGTVMDNLLITPLESIWEVHNHKNEIHDQDDEITAALLFFRNPMGLMTLPRLINEQTNMQAALPGIETNRLLKNFGSGIAMARILAILIVILSGISVFISLYNSLKDNRDEAALMLTLGASRSQLYLQAVLEGCILTGLGYVFGILLSKSILFYLNNHLAGNYNLIINWIEIGRDEIYLLILALITGIVAAAIPSINLYKLNISKTLAEE